MIGLATEAVMSPRASRPPVAQFISVSKSFPQSGGPVMVAVDEVELEVMEGDIVTILGPSGCGKSTLLNMLAGIFPASSGQVLYRGRPVTALNPKAGYMTQSDHLLPWRTIAGNVRAPLEILRMERGAADRRVAGLLETVGLSGFAGSYPSQVSGGMRKRTALARLLAYDPEALLLDEPFVALDAQLRLAMQSELRSLCRRLNKTMLFVTHDVDEAVGLGDRCVVFTARPGRIRTTVEIDLPPDRDLLAVRRLPRFAALTAELWELMSHTPAPVIGPVPA